MSGRSTIVATITASCLLAAAPAVADWRQYQHDARHTGFAHGAVRINPATVRDLSRSWAARVGVNPEFAAGVLAQVSEAGGVVFAGSDDRQVYAFDAGDGTRIWPAEDLGYCGNTTTPAVAATLVLSSWQPCYSSSGGAVGGWGRADGSLAYIVGREGQHSSVAVSRGTGYLGDGGLGVYDDVPALEKVDVATGDTSLLEIPGMRTGIAPAVGARKVFALRTDALVALRRGDLSQAWSAPAADLGGTLYSTGGVATDHGTVFATVSGGSTAAFDAGNGARLWTAAVGGKLAVDDSTVYVSGSGVTALDRATGEIRWSRARLDVSEPAVVPGIVFVAGERVWALDTATGETLWRSGLPPASTNGYRFVAPSVAGATLLSAIHRRVIAWRLDPDG
jgi:outer membrane protein assembly factor BamB